MKTILHKSESRGHVNYGWLNTHHTFSFANYYNPDRIQFGALRVINDDWIAPGMGFGTHPHDNMEIITIPTRGTVEHKDSMGNHGTITAGEIQVMSAGTGIFHSEYNHDKTIPLELFQIWVFPNKRNVTPRYDQISLTDVAKRDEFYQILSPDPDDQGVWIHQNAWFHLADLSAGWEGSYGLKDKSNGTYFVVVEGDVVIAGEPLNRRDAIGVTEAASVSVKATTAAKILVMEVPVK